MRDYFLFYCLHSRGRNIGKPQSRTLRQHNSAQQRGKRREGMKVGRKERVAAADGIFPVRKSFSSVRVRARSLLCHPIAFSRSRKPNCRIGGPFHHLFRRPLCHVFNRSHSPATGHIGFSDSAGKPKKSHCKRQLLYPMIFSTIRRYFLGLNLSS